MANVLEMNNICKSFNGIQVLNNVGLYLQEGEVLGLIGENGAGKSTLMKILCGNYSKDSGEIKIAGKPVEITSVKSAQKHGIGIIYQELTLFSDLNVYENIFTNKEQVKGKVIKFLDRQKMIEVSRDFLKSKLGTDIDVTMPVNKLRLAERELVEIARVLNSDAKVIVMDEPTAAVEDKEKEYIFNVIRELKKLGTSVIFVSHHLEELVAICDRVEVLRDGKEVANMEIAEVTIENIISSMIGKSMSKQYPKEYIELGEEILEVKNLTKKGAYEDVSFRLCRGEVLGIAGLAGCGKSELVKSLFGAFKYDGGKISLNGKEAKFKNTEDAIDNKIAFIPADRKTDGLFLDKDLCWNISIASMKKIGEKYVDAKKDRAFACEYIDKLGIKTSSAKQLAKSLSGGNQQKVMVSRWLMTDPEIVLMEEPTRGIDVNAKAEIYKLIMEMVKAGKAAIIVSSESAELLGICDNIIVMHNGKVVKVLAAAKSDEHEIARYSVQNVSNN